MKMYDMQWKHVDLRKHMVSGASYGGPIAMIPDERKVLMMGYRDDGRKPTVRVFTCAGQLISEFAFVKSYGTPVAMGWTEKEELVCCHKDGQVQIYSIHGDLIRKFSMGLECEEYGVAECVIWSTGLVCRTSETSKLVKVTSFDFPRPNLLPSSGLTEPPSCMTVVKPQFNDSGQPEVLLATQGGSIVVVDHIQSQDQLLTTGPFAQMVVSPTGRHVACFNDAGSLILMTVDFKKKVMKVDFKENFKNIFDMECPADGVQPTSIVWCGEHSMALYWQSLSILLLVEKEGHFLRYPYDRPLVAVEECDGVRLVTDKACEFLHAVPNTTENIFQIGSTTPSALLFDAAEDFRDKSVRADDNLRTIKQEEGALCDAIDECLIAAANEFDHATQRQLLQAVAFGKLRADEFKADTFVDMCRTLRVLNAVRHVEVAMPLTYPQYCDLREEVLVDRLIARHHHMLAFRICKYLHMSPERVLIHWACTKIRNAEIKEDDDEDDEALGRSIVDKLESLGSQHGLSFERVAQVAHEEGKADLAAMLLEYEPLTLRQVPLLLGIGKSEVALEKAIESYDSDLIYQVLFKMQDDRDFTQKEFWSIIGSKPLAKKLYIKYLKKNNLPLLKKFYVSLQEATNAGNVCLMEAYKETTWKGRKALLEQANFYFGEDKTNTFSQQAVKDQLDLMDYQEGTKDRSVIDQTVSEMIESFVEKQDMTRKLQVRRKFKVSEKRLWHLEVRTLARCKYWP